MSGSFTERLLSGIDESSIEIITGVPDGLFSDAIQRLTGNDKYNYIACAREEECIGVAAGAAIANKRAMILVQNAGFLNSLGAFGTLADRYALPIVFVIANRGSLGDPNSYDIEKFKGSQAVIRNLFGVFKYNMVNFSGGLVGDAFRWAESANRPCILSVTKV